MENKMYLVSLLGCDGSKCDSVETISDVVYDKEEAINDFNSVIKIEPNFLIDN